jgi:hypothetical protein
MDIGIQSKGDKQTFHLFEVNTYIDGPFFEIEDAVTHMDAHTGLVGMVRMPVTTISS